LDVEIAIIMEVPEKGMPYDDCSSLNAMRSTSWPQGINSFDATCADFSDSL
jgi:hypothetical protein